MTVRNYQNYENDNTKINTALYNIIFRKIENYDDEFNTLENSLSNEFKTNDLSGVSLQLFYQSVSKYEKRDCFDTLKKFIKNNYIGKICILY